MNTQQTTTPPLAEKLIDFIQSHGSPAYYSPITMRIHALEYFTTRSGAQAEMWKELEVNVTVVKRWLGY
jgi:hypothetical protein